MEKCEAGGAAAMLPHEKSPELLGCFPDPKDETNMFKGRVKGKTNKQFDYTLQALNPRMAETTPAVFSHETINSLCLSQSEIGFRTAVPKRLLNDNLNIGLLCLF